MGRGVVTILQMKRLEFRAGRWHVALLSVIAAVKNYLRLSALTEHVFIVLESWSPKSEPGVYAQDACS